MGEVRKKVLDEGVPMATVARLYKDSLFPVSEADKASKDKKDLKAAAMKLKELLAETNAVPRRLASTVGDALDELLAGLEGRSEGRVGSSLRRPPASRARSR